MTILGSTHVATDPVTLLQQLIRIPSESYHESQIGAFVLHYLRQMEISSWVDTDGNVFAEFGNANGPTLLLHAHMDTVPAGDGWEFSPHSAVIHEGRVYGRGACDAKGGLAAMLAAVYRLSRLSHNLQGKVMLAAVVREEISPPENKGTLLAIGRGLKADMAIVAEPTSLQPCIAQIGRTEYEISVIGKAAHANAPDAGKNAIVKMAEIIQELEQKISRPYSSLLARPSTFNIGVIHGGIQSNVVPDRCTVLIDRGLVPGQSAEESLQEIKGIVDGVLGDSDFQVEIRVPYQGYPAVIDQNEKVVQTLLHHVVTRTGKPISPGGFISHCDADWLITFAGIPAVIFGPGDLSVAHTNREYVDAEEVMSAADILTDTVLDLLKGDSGS